MPALLIVLVAAIASLAATPLVRRLAIRLGWLDRPDGTRKTHTTPVPRVGGLAVYMAFVFASALFAVLLPREDPAEALNRHAWIYLLVAAGAVMLLGLLDDLWGVRPWAKIAVQAAAGLYLYYAGYRIDTISNPFNAATTDLGPFALPVTLLWFVAMSNAFNLIDGLDGLAAGIGLFSTTALFIAAAINERWEVMFLSAALGGALLGFLRYNFYPASIFLGDSGALFVGFALAAIAVRGSMKSSAAIAVAAPLLALALPLLDAAVAIIRRFVSGKRVFEADGDHIHHRLLKRGFTPQTVVILLYGVAAAFGALSLLTMNTRGQVVGLVLIATSIVTWVGIQHLGYPEFGEVQRILRKGLLQERQAIGNNVYLQEMTERLRSAASPEEAWRLAGEMAVRLGLWSLTFQPEGRFSSWASRFPAWGAAEPPRDVAATITWTLPVQGPDARIGLLAAARTWDGSAFGFDNARLLEALQRGLGPGLARLSEAAEVPRPELAEETPPVLSATR
jgi:UDP-GlcNAc:undecaprenyl-phosphate/decaprenyl-phosphate GlcNAc-1-phosphate transferase